MAFVPAPGYQPAYNPPLPHVSPVPGGLRPGTAIYVQGVVPPHAKRFRVDLGAGGGAEGPLALHVNPRFGDATMVLNSRQGGAWGAEKRRSLGPLARGSPFELVINVTPGSYRLLVNGSDFEEFPHRLPPEQVTSVTVDGDVQLQAVNILGGRGMFPPAAMQGTFPPATMPGMYPTPMMPDAPQTIPYSQGHLPMMEQPPTFHPPVPFVATIPGGLTPKKTIVVKGFIPPDSKRFHINLRAGRGGDVLLHLNPRPSEGSVVRNSRLGGQWGSEERALPHNPLQRGRYFDLSIRCGNHRFKVFAEGQPLFDYAHRVAPGPHVDTLEVEGDVVLSYVHF